MLSSSFVRITTDCQTNSSYLNKTVSQKIHIQSCLMLFSTQQHDSVNVLPLWGVGGVEPAVCSYLSKGSLWPIYLKYLKRVSSQIYKNMTVALFWICSFGEQSQSTQTTLDTISFLNHNMLLMFLLFIYFGFLYYHNFLGYILCM